MGNKPVAAPTKKGKYKRGFCLIPDRPDIYSKHRRYDKFRDLPKATHPVNAVAVAENALILAAATLGTSDEVHLWDLVTKELKVSLHAHTAHVWDLEFSPNETALATASNDHSIRLWDTYTGEPIAILKGHTAGVRTLSFSAAGYLITGGMDSLLCLWEYGNPEPVHKWKAHEGDVHGVKFSRKDDVAAYSVGADGSIAVWNVLEGEDGLIGRFPGGAGSGVLCVAGHPEELGVVAAGNQDGAVWLWHFNSSSEGDPQPSGNQLRGHKGPVWCVAFTEDGHLMASGASDGCIRVWLVSNLKAPILVAVLPAHDSWVRQVHWGPYNRIFSCSVDGCVREWLSPKSLQNLSHDFQLDFTLPSAGGTGGSRTLLPEQVAGRSLQADATGDFGGLDTLPAEGDSLGDALRAAALVPVDPEPVPQAPVPPPPRQPPPRTKSWNGPAPPREPPPGTKMPWEPRAPPRPPPPGSLSRSGTLLPPFVPLEGKKGVSHRATLMPPVPPAPPPPPSRNPGPP